ncbi:YbaB/EbfC family nucleoid-associated protein [Helicobacter jaachi]|uniref:Nucleoid-associated protein LS71_009195 n=1 Tax=Helicobacter jaachi TaxID=1677920 RepID=A0A4U8T7N4_9HELI|nr:YbaB/EbfC family nucleoid-associated protein [Helicobacter jaachi]TLD94677.1 YbaB/EbfC family nucleoid-associated protein [Helicobacter jaachi]
MFDTNQFGAMLGSMQDSIKELEEQNKQTTLTAKSGGGLVSVSCNGNGEITDIDIDQSLLADRESLQILLISALNDLRKSVEDNRQSSALNLLSGLGGGLNIFGGKPNG